MADYVLTISSFAGAVPWAKHFKGQVTGEATALCHGKTTHYSGGKATCDEGHEQPGRVEWNVEEPWTEGRYERYAARRFEDDGPSQFRTEQDVVDCAVTRFLGQSPSRWWESEVTPGQPGDKLWAGWISGPGDEDLVQENWGTVIAEVPAAAHQETGG